jgi:hypothetical protein
VTYLRILPVHTCEKKKYEIQMKESKENNSKKKHDLNVHKYMSISIYVSPNGEQ